MYRSSVSIFFIYVPIANIISSNCSYHKIVQLTAVKINRHYTVMRFIIHRLWGNSTVREKRNRRNLNKIVAVHPTN